MRTMKIILIICLATIVLFVIVIPLIFLIFGIQSEPLIISDRKLNYQDATRIRQLIKENDPRRLKPGEISHTSITEADINLFIDHALAQEPGGQKIYAHVDLYTGIINSQFTFILPSNLFGNYLNVTIPFVPDSNRFRVYQLKVGALKIPRSLVSFATRLAHKFLTNNEQYQNLIDLANSIKEIEVLDKKVSIVYQWQPDIIQKLRRPGRDFLVSADDRELLRIYGERLAQISQSMNGQTVSLSLFLQSLFQFAQQRTAAGGNPQAENRALILNLATFSVGRNINKLIDPEKSRSYPSFGTVKLTLLGRNDLAKHFLVSAALTVSAGSALANFAGIFKEVDDSRGGSGFSFADLAADRAGVKLAEIANGSSQQASLLQKRMSNHLNENDYMPRIDNLPEGIQELEFKNRYKDLDSENYRMVEDEIARRIAACQVYQF